VYLYDIARDETTEIWPQIAYFPRTNGSICAWFAEPQPQASGDLVWPLIVYDIATGQHEAVGGIVHPTRPRSWAIVREDMLVLSLAGDEGTQDVYALPVLRE